ncbi:MAG TPA: hypothetical protein VH592_04575 [Gemmataceae bacterium]
MRHCLGKACAVMLLFAVAGCTVDSFLNRQIVVWGPKIMVPGSVGDVAAKLRDGLSEAGMLVNAKRTDTDYRISSVWKESGTVFCLHLHQMNDEEGIKTRVRMQWDRGGSEELWQLILKILNAPATGEDSASQRTESPGSP